MRSTLALGGSDLSISLLNCWWTCPRLFYWRYVHPHPGGEVGLEPKRTASPLLVGSATHFGLEAWYRSGWADGLYSLDAALTAARALFAKRRDEFTSEEQFSDDLVMVESLLRNYHTFWGPSGVSPEYPNIKVLSDAEGPIIERSYAIDLVGGYRLVVRPDMVVQAWTSIVPMEHKTSRASGAGRLISKMAMDAQATAEAAVLAANREGVANGVLVNVLIKDRGVRSKLPAFDRQLVSFPRDAFNDILRFAKQGVMEIEATIEKWSALAESGMDPVLAARRVFPMVGMFTGACVGFSQCSMYSLCSAPGREAVTLPNYKVRVYHTNKVTEEGESA